MTITKICGHRFAFEVGSIEVSDGDRLSYSALNQAIWRAQMIPDHRVAIVGREDNAEPQEHGCGERRFEYLRQRFIAAQVDVKRVERLPGSLNDISSGSFARRATITLFPRVARILGNGQPLLSCDEIHALRTAREIVLFRPDEYTSLKRKILERYTVNDWMRIVGHECCVFPSLRFPSFKYPRFLQGN